MDKPTNLKNLNKKKKGTAALKTINKINYKQIIEKAKSVLLIMIFTGAVAFVAGVNFEKSRQVEVDHKVQNEISKVDKAQKDLKNQ